MSIWKDIFNHYPLLLTLQFLVNLTLFQNCCLPFTVLLLMSPVPQALVLKSSSSDLSHLSGGFPTSWVPSGLRRTSVLQGSRFCILKRCPSHLNLPIFIILTMSSSLQSVQSSLNVSCSPLVAYPGILFGDGGFNKFSWGQRTERMEIWGR